MLILSVLQDKIQVFRQQKPLFGKKQFGFSSISVDPLESKNFNLDKWALYLKEALTRSGTPLKSQKVKLILGLRFWEFQRIEIPVDIKDQAIEDFLNNKLKELNPEIQLFKFYLAENRGKSFANVFAISNKQLKNIQTLLAFFDLKILEIYPDPILLFQLFNQTLSTKKEEPILFLEYNKIDSSGMLYDYLGLRDKTPLFFESKLVLSKIKEISKEHGGISRLILSGDNADKVRQDNFTKETGVWTNPLTKIIDNGPYLAVAKRYNLTNEKLIFCRELVLLESIEQKTESKFALIQKSSQKIKLPALTNINLNNHLFKNKNTNKVIIGSILLILISASITFGIFNLYLYFQKNPLRLNLPKFDLTKKKAETKITTQKKAIPTIKVKKPTAIPTINKKEILIEIQNGVGTAGLANKLKTALEEKGYTIETVDNADNFNYKKSVIITDSKATSTLLEKDLKEQLINGATFEKTNSKKTTIIIGKDMKLL